MASRSLLEFKLTLPARGGIVIDQDQLGLRGVLHVPEEERLRVQDLERDCGAASSAELVT